MAGRSLRSFKTSTRGNRLRTGLGRYRKTHYRVYRRFPGLENRASVVLGLPPHAVIVDVGSNIGRNLEGFRALRDDLTIHALDIQDFRDILEGKGCLFHPVDLLREPFPFESGSVDCVTAMHIVEHLESPHHLLQESWRILKPAGRLFVEAPGVRSLSVPSFHFRNVREPLTFNFYDDPTHVKPYSVRELSDLLNGHAFRVLKSGISRNRLFFFLSPLLLLCGVFSGFLFHAGLINLMGWSVYCIAEPKK